VTIPAWGDWLRVIAPGGPPIDWLPVPSNVRTEVPADQAAQIRQRIAPRPGAVVVGHFGTFGAHVAPLLRAVLPGLLAADPRRVGLLIGRHGDVFARELDQAHPALRGRLVASGALPSEEIAAHLGACDLLVQPYPDGVSSRRTSLMAGLALGLPIVTSEGRHSESLWRTSGAVAVAAGGTVDGMMEAAENLLADPERRMQLGARARMVYQENFSLERLIQVLRSGV
jgi:glycosyltransferase involved in cell wall biosynthesis